MLAVFFFNSLPNNKVLDWSTLKALADDNISVTEKLKFVSRRVENIAGKEKMLVTSIFSQSFQKISSTGCAYSIVFNAPPR